MSIDTWSEEFRVQSTNRVLLVELRTSSGKFPWTYPSRAYRRVIGAAFGAPLLMPFGGFGRRWVDGVFVPIVSP